MFLETHELHSINAIRILNFLESDPRAVKGAIELGLDCVGCRMAKHCTIEEALKQYQVDEKEFVTKFQDLLEDIAPNFVGG